MRKVRCRECDWRGTTDELLEAFSPFDGVPINGCPQCKAIDSGVVLCDEPGCTADGECRTPTVGGYRFTCSDHIPSVDLSQESGA